MVALVHRPALAQRQRVDRVEFQHLDAAVLHLREQRRGGEQRAHAVANYIDLHAGALFGDQRGGKALADFVVVKDVGFHVDVVACAFDGGQHGAVRLGAVAQQAHTVAGGQRAAGHRFFHRQVALKGVAVGRAPGQPFQHCPALRWTQRPVSAQQLRRRPGARGQVGHQRGQAAAAPGQAQRAGQGQQPAVRPAVHTTGLASAPGRAAEGRFQNL